MAVSKGNRKGAKGEGEELACSAKDKGAKGEAGSKAKEADKEQARFQMLKARHGKRFEQALGAGEVDERLVGLCRRINASADYFTSSGCSGRIMLLGVPESGRKKDAYFHRKWHRQVKVEEVLEGLHEKSTGELWLKAEGFILHVGCRSMDACRKLLDGLRECGIKRAGIMAPKPGKWIVEAVSTQVLNAPVRSAGGGLLVGEEYLGVLVEKANRKMERNESDLSKIEAWCNRGLK